MANRRRLDEIDAEVAKATPRPKRAALARRQSMAADAMGGNLTMAQHRKVSPRECRPWPRHNRMYDRLVESDVAGLMASIKAQGQRVPAIARELDEPDGEIRFEIVAGARRLFASTLLMERGEDIPFVIQVTDVGDEEAFRLSDAENRDREDISDFERAHDYDRALTDFYGGTARAMAQAIGLPEKELSRYLSLARLPSYFTDRLDDPRDLRRDHGSKLRPALKKHTQKQVEAALDKLSDGRDVPVSQAVKAILALGNHVPSGTPAPLDVVGANGSVIGRITRDGARLVVNLKLDEGGGDADLQGALRDAIQDVLNRAG